MEIASNLTSFPTAILMRGMIQGFKLVFASQELNILEDLVKKSQLAQQMLIMMVFNASATLDTSFKAVNAQTSTSLSPLAQLTHSLTECPAPATQDSIKAVSMLVLLVHQEQLGMELNAQLLSPVQMDISSTLSPINASHPLLHVELVLTGTVQLVFAQQDLTLLTDSAKNVQMVLLSMEVNALVQR